MNLWHILEHAATTWPHSVAVICNGKRITYGRLYERASCLADALSARGIKKGCKAGILSHNCTEYIEIIFALMKIGGVCVPLNCRLTAEDLAVLVRHADSETLFFSEDLAEKVPQNISTLRHLIDIDTQNGEYQKLFSKIPRTSSDTPVTDRDEAFIMYTAGTTGTPKGVVLTHGNLFWNTMNYTAAYGMSPSDRELAPTPLFHTSTLGRTFTYIFNGAAFVLCEKFDPEACLTLIAEEKITALTQAPTMFLLMHNALQRGGWDTRSVRRVVTGAAPMRPQQKTGLQELFPRAAFFDVYGMTEASPGIAFLGPHDFFQHTTTVGKPMLSVEVMIEDDTGNSAERGTIGEVLCRGPNIMKGYYKDTQSTETALSGGWLHTGDIGMIDEEGFLSLVGRKKDIIISGGVNIYPADIEQVLLQHPAVADAAVIGLPDEKWGEAVSACLVLRQNMSYSAEAIKAYCKKHLADFKCPRTILFMDELPRNAAQKVPKTDLKVLCSRRQDDT